METSIERFEKKIERVPFSTCWLWIASTMRDGYGTFFFHKKVMLAHRVAWILYKGELPDDIDVLHKCDVKYCVNPDHLYLGSDPDNATDAVIRKRNFNSAKMECIQGHPLYGANLYVFPNEKRMCRICQLERRRDWTDRNKNVK